MQVSNDYTNRILDTNVFGKVNPDMSMPISITSSFGTVSTCITGLQKLVQQYTVLLCNSGFIQEIRYNKHKNISEASQIFYLYNWDVVQILRQKEKDNPSMPNDERLDEVTVEEVLIGTGYIKFKLKLTSADGNATFILPLSFT